VIECRPDPVLALEQAAEELHSGDDPDRIAVSLDDDEAVGAFEKQLSKLIERA